MRRATSNVKNSSPHKQSSAHLLQLYSGGGEVGGGEAEEGLITGRCDENGFSRYTQLSRRAVPCLDPPVNQQL